MMNRKTIAISITLLAITVITMVGGRDSQSLRAFFRTPLVPLFKTMTFFSNTAENRQLIMHMLDDKSSCISNDYVKRTLEAENRELRKILGMKNRIEYDIITAEILERTLDMNGCIILDKGIASGVDRQMGIMYLNGIIGKIIESGQNTSVAETYLNINYRVSVTDGQFSDYFICRSGGDGYLYIDINDDFDLNIGDTVFTSGLGKLYPPGIPVGIFMGGGCHDGDSALKIEPIQHVNTDFIFIIKYGDVEAEQSSNNKETKLGKIGWYSIKSTM